MRGVKKILYFLLTPLLVTTSGTGAVPKAKSEKNNNENGNLWIKTGYQDFSQGQLDGVAVTQVGNGEIVLEKQNGYYKPQGVYTSQEIQTAPFEYMVLSWNADTPVGTSVKIEAQVLVNKGKTQVWSKWLSYGTWSTSRERASENPSEVQDDLARINTDTLTIRGNEGETGISVRYRLTLITENSEETPVIRLVAGTLRNTIPGQAIPSVYSETENIPDLNSLDKEIDIPSYSQYQRDPKIAHYICSPTSITSILNYHGVRLLPEEAAWGVYDDVYEGFGNWPFSTAYASSHGFTSYVRYCESINDLKREIYLGYPTAVSVKYKNSAEVEGDLPVIHGAPISRTPGHLLVVRGFTFENGKEYVIVSDSAAATDEDAKRRYLVEEFDKAWQRSGRTAYIVHEGEGGVAAPTRQVAQLREIKMTASDSQPVREFELHIGNEIIDLSKENVKTIMLSRDGGKYEYIAPSESKTLLFENSRDKGNYEFLIIAKGNRIYTVGTDIK